MIRVSMIVCVLSMCFLAHGDDYGLPPVLIQCSNCMGAIPVGAFVVSGLCKVELGSLTPDPESLLTTKLPDEKVYAGSCSNPEPRTSEKELSFGTFEQTSYTIEGGISFGWAAGWTVTGNINVGYTCTWGSSYEVTIKLDSYSPGNAEIETTYSITRTDFRMTYNETRKGWMMCRYPDASPDAQFLVWCPDEVVSHDGGPKFMVVSREIGTKNVCPPPPISGLCS